MNNKTTGRHPALSPSEKDSIKMLTDKMGMSKKELSEVNNKYGVSASKLVELMQLSRYQFVYTDKIPGQCDPCHNATGRLRAVNF